jgi:hypothetical protein
MNEPKYATSEVHRVIARDDLLMTAALADEAVSIVGHQVSLARLTRDDPSLFVIALDHYLKSAQEGKHWSTRMQAWDSAAVIVRFGEMVGLRPDCVFTPRQMHANALAENVADGDSQLDRALAAGVIYRYHAARDLRLTGDSDAALSLVMRPVTKLYGTGAEPHMAHYLFERGANHLATGQAGQIADALLEWDDYWEKTRAKGYSTRYRFDFIRALAYWDSGEHDPDDVLAHLDLALRRLRQGERVPVVAANGELRPSDDDHGVRELSVILTKAEFLAAHAGSAAARIQAVALARRAVGIANDVRGRMRVIARSRAPLAAAFRRLYGDIALLADRLGTAGVPGAAELGLQVALTAKQTGFAARMRADRGLMNDFVQGVLDEIVDIENETDDSPTSVRTADERTRRLGELHFKLRERVSSMLAETVLPSRVDVGDLITKLGPRSALDYLELPNTLDDRLTVFRSLVGPGRPALFERFEPAEGVRTFFAARRQSRDLFAGVSRDAGPAGAGTGPAPFPGWGSVASVLPDVLRAELAGRPPAPVPLVVSAHSWLSLVPWAALAVDDEGTRLIEHAVLTQTPVLTCLSPAGAPPVEGQALVRLVGSDGRHEPGVDVSRERTAWGFPAGNGGVRLSSGPLSTGEAPKPCTSQRLSDVLVKDAGWAFLHVASHGRAGIEEDGLRQVLVIPEQPLTAARALALHWPASVLMASCHVGQVVNAQDAEPLNFVMALLTGGAQCVVAGMAAIADEETGKVAHHIVKAIRGGTTSLDHALRAAQLDAIERKTDEAGWALLTAYVR